MPRHVGGSIKEIIYAQFDPGEDLLEGIRQVAIGRDITTGVVLSITGSVTQARLSWFPTPGPVDETATKVFDIPGPLEVSGHGILGRNAGDGSPYVHVHLAVTTGEHAVMGHLEPGTLVRSRI